MERMNTAQQPLWAGRTWEQERANYIVVRHGGTHREIEPDEETLARRERALNPPPPIQEPKPPTLSEQIRAVLTDEYQTSAAITEAMGGNRKAVSVVLGRLVAQGYADIARGPRNAYNVRVSVFRRSANPPTGAQDAFFRAPRPIPPNRACVGCRARWMWKQRLCRTCAKGAA